jgi:hypothetical protein
MAGAVVAVCMQCADVVRSLRDASTGARLLLALGRTELHSQRYTIGASVLNGLCLWPNHIIEGIQMGEG